MAFLLQVSPGPQKMGFFFSQLEMDRIRLANVKTGEKEGEVTMFKDFWKIDPSLGESRFAQLLGIWLLSCLIAFLVWHFEGANHHGTNIVSASLSFSDKSGDELENTNVKGANTAFRQFETKNKK